MESCLREVLTALWAVQGAGEACALCGEILPRTQMELEAEFSQDGEIPELHKYHLHPRCFAAWEYERARDDAHS